MKKFILVAAMGALFFIGLTSMINMSPPENTTCKDQCSVLVSLGIFQTQGKCMSACNTCLNKSENATQQAVCFCKVIDAIDGLENYGLNFGQCVTLIK